MSKKRSENSQACKKLAQRKVGEVVEGASAGRGATTMSTPSSFTKTLTSKYQIHTSNCQCLLTLPNRFSEKHKVKNHVTMTDSTGLRLWHMVCNNRKVPGGRHKITNGWREFAYDHSLKLNDKLVFTLVSTSHFVVEFATREMRPTQDGKEYPWGARRNIWSRINYLENLPSVASGSSGSDDISMPPRFTKVLKSKYEIHTSIRHCRLSLPMVFCDEHGVLNQVTMTDSVGLKLWHMRCQSKLATRGVFRISNGWREFAYDHGLKQNDKLVFTLVSPSHFVVEFGTSKPGLSRVMRPTHDGRTYPWRLQRNWREFETPPEGVAMQTPELGRMLDRGSAVNRNSKSWKDSTSKPKFPEFTHLECKNPDGTSYLQMLDSDGEVTDEDEEIAPDSYSP